MAKKTFLYFAFGSNLLTERIQINNPSAVFRNIAKLRDHKLDFNYFSQRWQGAAATIIPTLDSQVWGVLWELDMEHLETLDMQESVPTVYNRKTVEVELQDGTKEEAFTYFMVKPEEEDKRPSYVYKDVIVRGAEEHNIPQEYLDWLRGIEDNGYRGDVNVALDLKERSKIKD
eukprot:TRINITY_DN12421_c0_g1_i1.p1 TRINITY_DN12421_c0_g1~~TRINITY_DN12421_c0_g1_i1.p1  ORF type:complete len:186 (-),score=78.48 TRINITY_DN12421_c0_g1_i1:50-568(-)